MSLCRSQASDTVPPDTPVTLSPLGLVHDGVVNDTGWLGADSLPALSTATTLAVYAVFDSRPPKSVRLGDVVGWLHAPSIRITYHLRPTLSVEPVNANVAMVGVKPVSRRLDGAVGGCVSAPAATAGPASPAARQAAPAASSR